MTATFFGHRDAPETILPILRRILINLIEQENVTCFLVGNEGCFDLMVRKSLINLSEVYPKIRYSVVLAYLSKKLGNREDFNQTLYPEGVETVPPRFAISKRNLWMMDRADIVVVYVTVPFGNSFRLMNCAKAKGKKVINVANYV